MSVLPKAEYLEHHMHQLGWVKVTYCKDCKHYSPFTEETVSWCPVTGLKGLPADAYCYVAEKKETE